MTPPKVYICSYNGKLVDANYPNAVEYERADIVNDLRDKLDAANMRICSLQALVQNQNKQSSNLPSCHNCGVDYCPGNNELSPCSMFKPIQ